MVSPHGNKILTKTDAFEKVIIFNIISSSIRDWVCLHSSDCPRIPFIDQAVLNW